MADGDGQKLRAWPFAAASMAVGAFAILPYLIFKTPHEDWSGTKTVGLRIWDWRGWGAIGLAGAILCFSSDVKLLVETEPCPTDSSKNFV
jgi:hypothetical protein